MNPKTLAAACLVLGMASIGSGQTTAPAVPKGEVKQYEFAGSKIYPGTVRDYWVYVPKQYDGSKPACLFVNQDGIYFKTPEVFDQLIASGEMPVTIAVFVKHGRVKALDDKTALDRFNRSYEYDSVGDTYSRFLLDEFLPYVEETHHLKLSHDPNDRCIGGASSGAICAFNVAWERPDSFSRVFSSVGTFVGLRGGNEFPTLLRKTEPKPLRVFLEDGSHDLNIYGGDWWMANQEMERAFIYSGYEVNHAWGEGGHDGKHATAIFADAMRWLWKGYPEKVTAGKGSDKLQELLVDGQGWQEVGTYGRVDGLAANAKGEVFFKDAKNTKVYRIASDGKISEFLTDVKGGGLAIGPDGRLYGLEGGTTLKVYDADGKSTVIADGFTTANDLVIRSDGSTYITESGKDGVGAKVWFIPTKGEKRVVADQGIRLPNGITLSPDQSLLYVGDYRSRWVWSYQIAADGSLNYGQKYYHLHEPDSADDSGADGMHVDRDGRLWVTTRMGLQVSDQAGRVNCIIPMPGGKSCSSLCFGGEGFGTVFVTCGDHLFKRMLKVKGAQAYDTPNKPEAPKL